MRGILLRAAPDLGADEFVDPFAVTNTDDSGPGSLRQAIVHANASPGADAISFAMPGEGVHTIRPLSPLPEVTGPTAIDGRTQPGYAGLPLIELDGGEPVSPRGLNVSGADSLVAGLSIHGFVGFNQMWVHADRAVVVANHIGTGPLGTELDGVQPAVPLQVQGLGSRSAGPTRRTARSSSADSPPTTARSRSAASRPGGSRGTGSGSTDSGPPS
ncbi:MAG: hypothetical protein ACRD0U_13250 [Acidimicrobiales bacterium]